MILDKRKIKILSAIIEDYIATAEPIGSRTIAKKYHIGISPATIRNEMADLEELGYISQPHTSAGRVPSNKGYRFYVDFLMPKQKLSPEEQILIGKLFKRRIGELEELVEEAAGVISKLTSYTTIILGPQLDTCGIKYIQISQLEEGKGLLIIVTDCGTISHNIIEIPRSLTESDLTKITNLLNDKLIGKTFSDISNEMIDTIKSEIIEYDEVLNILLDVLMQSLDDTCEQSKIVYSGSSKMLEYPEFKNVDKVKKFLTLLEQQVLLSKALKTASKPDGIAVTIGTENPLEELQDYSLVTASFALDGKNLGICGIMGPTRMEYSKVVTVLKKFTDYLNKMV